MSADISELIEQIRAAAENATDGPWTLRIESGDYIVWSASDDYMMCDTGYYPTALNLNDAQYVVAVNPDNIRRLLDHIAELEARTEWRDMESAPRDGTVINVVGRYPDATAGFPRYAAFLTEDDGWFELSRNKPERIIPWAWRPRDGWPQEPARPTQERI